MTPHLLKNMKRLSSYVANYAAKIDLLVLLRHQTPRIILFS